MTCPYCQGGMHVTYSSSTEEVYECNGVGHRATLIIYTENAT